MAFFDELSSKAKKFVGTATDKAKELADVATDKAKEAADATKQTAAILAEQRNLDKSFKAIGEWYVSLEQEEIPEAIADVVAAAKASQAKIAELKAQRQKGEEEVEEVIVLERPCPLCGGLSEGKFCPFCGAPMGE